MAYLDILSTCFRALDISDPNKAHKNWITERECLRSVLRDLCDEFGDNDWPDDLWMPDVVEKHLARHLRAHCRTRRPN